MIYYEGRGTKQDYNKAREWLQKASEAGLPQSQCLLGDIYRQGLGIQKDIEKAFKWYLKSAEQGYPTSQYNVAGMYYTGKGAPDSKINLVEAYKWLVLAESGGVNASVFRDSVKQKLTPEQIELAQQKINNFLTRHSSQADAQSMLATEKFYMIPASGSNQPDRILSEIPVPPLNEDPNILFSEGRRYQSGNGVIRDYRRAAECYQVAAEKGHTKAQVFLGHLYHVGWGVEKDNRMAFYWLDKAAGKEDYIAQYTIGLMLQNGEGVEQDYEKAVHWYKKSADQGYFKAQYNLGRMYEQGRGVPVDYQEMKRLYLLAAQQGDDFAQIRLFFVYALGWGVPIDFVEAYKWCLVAGTNGQFIPDDVENNLTSQMKGSQLELARQRARDFIEIEQKKAPETYFKDE